MNESFIKRNLLLIIAFSIPTLFLIILCIFVLLYPSKNSEKNLSFLDPNEMFNQNNQPSDDYYEDNQNYNNDNYSYENDSNFESPVPLENFEGDAIFASCNSYNLDTTYQDCVYFVRNMFVVKNNRLIPNFGEIDVTYEPAFYYYQVSTKKLESILYEDVISKTMVDSLKDSPFVENIEDVYYGESITSYGNLVLGPNFYFIGYTEK